MSADSTARLVHGWNIPRVSSGSRVSSSRAAFFREQVPPGGRLTTAVISLSTLFAIRWYGWTWPIDAINETRSRRPCAAPVDITRDLTTVPLADHPIAGTASLVSKCSSHFRYELVIRQYGYRPARESLAS